MMRTRFYLMVTIMLLSGNASAQTAQSALSKDQPIEISADMLDVHQEEHKAIFSGNVIATQGQTNLRAKTMTVFYRQGSEKSPDTGNAQGISRIEADGGVVFATPTETAQGDTSVYNADTDMLELMGANVTLTREQNILKGQKLVYNLSTGRSVLSAGGAPVTGENTGKTGRVHGLFVPKSDKAK